MIYASSENVAKFFWLTEKYQSKDNHKHHSCYSVIDDQNYRNDHIMQK